MIQLYEITLVLGDVQDLCCSEMDDDDGNFWERHAIFAGDGGGGVI